MVAPRQNARWLLALVLCWAAALAVQGQTLAAGFAFDDPIAVQSNRLVTGESAWWAVFRDDFWGARPGFEHLASWRPLTLLTLRADHAAGAGEPWPFHAQNLAWHLALIAVLVLGALRRHGATPLAAGAAGLLVAVHPAAAEAVASVVGRGDLLAAFFAVAGVAALLPHSDPAHVRQRRASGEESEPASRSRADSAGKRERQRALPGSLPGSWRPAWALPWLAMALLSKETALITVAAVLVWCLIVRRHGLAASVAALVAAWWVLRSLAVGATAPIPVADNPLAALPLSERFGPALGLVGRLAEWLVVPQPIAADYALGVRHDASDLVALGVLAGVTVSLGLVVAWRRREAALALGLAWIGAALVLMSNLLVVLPAPIAGRFALWPLLGLAIVTGVGASRLRGRRRTLAVAALGAVAVVGAPASLTMAAAWHDDASLFTMSVDVEPDSVRARVNLAVQLLRRGDAAAAEDQARAALDRVPDHPGALLHLALALDRQGPPRAAEAWRVATRAAEVPGASPKAAVNRCAIGLRVPALPPHVALDACRDAATRMPGAAEAQIGLARALARAGRDAEAEVAFRGALQAHPGRRMVQGTFVGFLASRGRLDEAVALQRRLVESSPDDPKLRGNLTALLMQSAAARKAAGDASGACERATEAARLTPAPVVRRRADRICGDR